MQGVTYTNDTEVRMVDHLERTWASHEDRQWSEGVPLLHLYGTDSAGYWHEVGNIPLGYDGPVVSSADRAIADWTRLTGREVRRTTAVVTVHGADRTHYGVEVSA
jgi:hypothetical protein